VNILYLIDPNSIHDQKWIRKFTNNPANNCFFICREHYYNYHFIKQFEIDFQISFVGTVDYFSFKKLFGSIKQVIRIKRTINEYEIELFNIQYAEPNALWALFRELFGIPIIITCRGTDVLKTIPNHFRQKDIFNKLIAWAYKKSFLNASGITVTSTGQWDSLNKLIGSKKEISIIRTGIDLKGLRNDTSAFLPKEVCKSYILFPRYIKPIYNHEFAIEALKKLPTELKQKYQMVFVGKNSGDLRYQNLLICSLKEDEAIDFLFLEKQGQEAIWELYKNAELIIMTPKSDGSPVSGMEAIALHKKLILGPLEYDKDVFSQPNVFPLEDWNSQELSSLIEKLINIDGYEAKQSPIYLKKIDNKDNMQLLQEIYNKVIETTQ
jgi:glycosyltransferase involved in cell wall biosynthesis